MDDTKIQKIMDERIKHKGEYYKKFKCIHKEIKKEIILDERYVHWIAQKHDDTALQKWVKQVCG